MTFEEKKQEIIQNIIKIQHNIHKYSKSIISLTLEHLVIYELKELQPDKPTCNTCKYFFNNDGFSACTNKKCEDVLGNISVNIELNECRFHATRSSFGCIYHDKA